MSCSTSQVCESVFMEDGGSAFVSVKTLKHHFGALS